MPSGWFKDRTRSGESTHPRALRVRLRKKGPVAAAFAFAPCHAGPTGLGRKAPPPVRASCKLLANRRKKPGSRHPRRSMPGNQRYSWRALVRRTVASVALPFCAAGPALVCAQALPPNAVAVVNGVVIERQALRDVIDALAAQQGQRPDAAALPSLRRQALDLLIGFELLHQEAKARQLMVSSGEVTATMSAAAAKFGSEEAYRAALNAKHLTLADIAQETRKTLLVDRLLREVVWKDLTIPESAVRSFYEENREQFRHPEEVRLRQILVRVPPGASAEEREAARRRAESLAERLRRGESFAELARAESDDPASARRGGDLGYMARGTLAAPVEDVAFSLPPGKTSGVIASPFGFHIVAIEGRRESGYVPFEEVRERIAAVLEKEEQRRRQDAFVAELRRKASIQVAPDLDAPAE